MALKPFARHSKSEADTETVPDEDDAVDQFFSNSPRPFANESRPAATPPEAADENPVPVAQPVEAPEFADAGWYPDASDPELKRYWDGHHWTGQTMQVIPERRGTDEIGTAPAMNPTQTDRSSTGPVAPATDLLVPGQTVAPGQTVVPSHPEPLPTIETPATASTAPDVTTPSSIGAGTVSPSPVEPPPAPPSSFGSTVDTGGGVQARAARPLQDSDRDSEVAKNPDAAAVVTAAKSPPEAKSEADTWFAEVARAVGRAQETESPEAWQEAARVALVVSEVAQTMRAMAEAELEAQTAAQTAQEARQNAALAEKRAVEANGTVAQTARTAQIAADEARAAAQAADEAKRIAERAAEEVPKSAGMAKVAAQVAADAADNAKGIGEIVAKARVANTQEAWTEALGLVTMRPERTRGLSNGSDPTV